MSKTNANTSNNIVTNTCQLHASIGITALLELDARQRFRVDDAGDRPDLVDDDLAEDVEVVRLDLRDQVVLPEQGVELHDFFDLQELVVHLVLLSRSGANEHEPDSHP